MNLRFTLVIMFIKVGYLCIIITSEHMHTVT